jgi:hypothetical protein
MENTSDKHIEIKNKLIKDREVVKEKYKILYKENTKEIARQMQIIQTKTWKDKNPYLVSMQKKRRYIWIKETTRLRNILLQ